MSDSKKSGDAKSCDDCGHFAGFGRCRRFVNATTGEPRFTIIARAEKGPCGPAAEFYLDAARPSATILPFPAAHRVSA